LESTDSEYRDMLTEIKTSMNSVTALWSYKSLLISSRKKWKYWLFVSSFELKPKRKQ